MDKLNLAQVKVLLCAAAELIKDKQQELTDIDGKYGDGDHGITMGKISDAILHGCQTGKQETVSALCDDLAWICSVSAAAPPVPSGVPCFRAFPKLALPK